MTNSADQRGEALPTGEAGWQAIGKLDPRALGKARSLALNIVQWPACIANSFVAGSTWPERMRLQWQSSDDSIVTQPFERELRLTLQLRTLNMCFLERGRRVPHTFDPEGRSPAEAEAWILVELLHRNIDRTRFSKALPYQVPDLMTGDAEDYSLRSCAAELAELAAWYHNAAVSFARIVTSIGASDVRIECGPRDLTMICLLNSASGQVKGPQVELGFSPGRKANDEPYFYVAPGQAAEDKRLAQDVMRTSTIAAAIAPEESLRAFLRDAAARIRQG